MANIKVAVRVRPISARELNLTGSELVVRTSEPNEIFLTNLKVSSSKAGDSRERIRRYGFDYCFDSSNPEARNYATQATIYETLGQSILDTMFSGYNSCLVAYGQSASGKTYTMMGTKEDPGLIPRLCKGIFSKVEEENEREKNYRVTISYFEIYNEKVRDLLKPSTSASGLRVREHPRLGPYVQGLTHHVVRTLGSLMSYVEEGTKARKTASTLQNPSSSRSHALLTVNLSQDTSEQRPGDADGSSRRQDAARASSSRLHLVDLAGSESAATCSGIHRLKEGANINKSLVALGNVISALAERGSTGTGPGKRYIPYRDSSLTWLLKDALGGNATTIMLATISPASGSYNETAHTLRFAQRAQSVVNRPMVNEDPVERIIRELKAEIARLKSLLLEKDIDGNTKAPCCCGKVQSLKCTTTELPNHEEQISSSERFDRKDESKDEKSLNALPLRRSNSSDSVTTCETGSSDFIRRSSSCDLQSSDRFNYNRAKITELNDEEDEIVNEINEPVFVDIPTLVAVLIKPDDSLQESSTQIEEICSDEVQEDSIDTDFIEGGNEEFEESEKIDDIIDRSNFTNLCNGLKDTEIGELHHQISPDSSPRSPSSVGRNESRGKFSKQKSVDLPSSNLNVSRKFGSIEGISKKKEPIFGFQRSHTNLEKHSSLPDRGKKLNNIREIDDHKASIKSGNIWKTIGNKDLLQRKSSNESDKSLKESSSGRTSGYFSNFGRKPSLENLKRKTSKDSSSSSSKEEQILISNLTRDKLLRRKNSLEQEATTSGTRYHTAIQRVKRSEIVAAVTERLYSSRKQTDEPMDIRSPPEGIDTKVSNNLVTRSKLQDISRKMLLRRRRVNVDTQTEPASTLRLKDTASLTDEEPKVILQDAAILTDDHTDVVTTTSTQRLPVLRVKDMATLTDRRPQTDILRCKDVGCLANDLNFDDYDELHSSRNDSGVLSDDTQNYESNLSSAEVSELSPESDRRVPYADSSTNTHLALSGKDSAVQTVRREKVANRELTNQKVVNQKVTDQKENSENRSCGHCCSLIHQHAQCLMSPMTNNIEKNVISISLPDMINITIESTNGLESRIAVTDGDTASDTAEEKPKSISSDKESQTIEINNKCEESSLQDPAVRSTAVQADGRVFRIENIFQDTRIKNCYDAVSSDSRREVATKKSVTLRNSRGTEYSSVIEMTESGAETEWDEMQPVEKIYQTKRPIVKGLTQTFIARKRSYSASPERTASELIDQDSERLWKNWTIPYSRKLSELIDYYSRETQLPAQRDSEVEQADHFSTSTMSNEYTPADQISSGTVQELSDQNVRLDKSEKLKSASINSLLGYDYNFSDDSLDRDEDNFRENLTDKNIEDLEEHEKYESLCPPDVVAHTKKEISKSASHTDSISVESMDNDFDDNEVSLPKKKPTEISDKKSPIQDYKALILGTSSYVVGSDSEEETTAKAYGQTDSVSRKKVSFSEPSSPEKITDTLATSRNTLTPRQNSLKSIIKKITPKNSNVTQQNIETDQLLRKKEVESAINEKVSSAFDGNRDFENSEESLNDNKAELSDYEETCNESDNTVNSDEDICYHMIPKRNILEEYLNEAMTFMRNMNSINEYMSATSMLDSYKKHRRRRRGNRGNKTNMDKNYIQYRGRKVSLKDDTDKYLRPSEDDIVAAESYEKCIRGIERLEACIDKVNRHNQVLQDRYGISVESAGAKSGLANSSIDSKLSSGRSGDNVIRRCGKNAVAENGAESCDESSFSRISSPFLSSIQTQDVTRFSTLNGTEKYGEEAVGKFGKQDLDEKNNNVTSDDDLERKIFRQLMSAVDSRKCWNRRREKQLRKITDLGSQSPTTYSEVSEAFRQNASGIINFDEVSVAGDYLGDIRGIESSLEDFKRTKLSDAEDTDSKTDSVCSTIDFEESCYDRNKLSKRNDNLSRISMPSESTRYFNCLTDHSAKLTGQTFNVEEDIARKNTHVLKDSLKIEPTNFRLDSPLELKYPSSPRAKFLELLRERRRIVENSRSTNAF